MTRKSTLDHGLRHRGRSEGIRRVFGMLALIATVGCSVGCSDNATSLSGSVSEIYDLSFQSVRARQYDSEFAIEYTRSDGQVSVRVIVERGDEREISAGEIDLGKRGTIVGRVGPRRLPEFRSGTLTLDSYQSEPGAEVAGSFDSTLRGDDSTYSLRGRFFTHLTVVDGSLGYRHGDAGDASEGGDAEGGGDSGAPEASGSDGAASTGDTQ